MQIQQDGMNHSILTAKSWSVIFSPCFLLSFLVFAKKSKRRCSTEIKVYICHKCFQDISGQKGC